MTNNVNEVKGNKRSTPNLDNRDNILSQLFNGAEAEVDEEQIDGFWRYSDGSACLKAIIDQVAYVDINDVPNGLPSCAEASPSDDFISEV